MESKLAARLRKIAFKFENGKYRGNFAPRAYGSGHGPETRINTGLQRSQIAISDRFGGLGSMIANMCQRLLKTVAVFARAEVRPNFVIDRMPIRFREARRSKVGSILVHRKMRSASRNLFLEGRFVIASIENWLRISNFPIATRFVQDPISQPKPMRPRLRIGVVLQARIGGESTCVGIAR